MIKRNAVTAVQHWETTDGQNFDDKAKAEAHQLHIDRFLLALGSIKDINNFRNVEQQAYWIVNHRLALRTLLDAMDMLEDMATEGPSHG